jgi:hypothetical protein
VQQLYCHEAFIGLKRQILCVGAKVQERTYTEKAAQIGG